MDEADAAAEFAISRPGCIVLGLHLVTSSRESGKDGDETFRERARQLVDWLIMHACGAQPDVWLGSGAHQCVARVMNGKVATAEFWNAQGDRGVRTDGRQHVYM